MKREKQDYTSTHGTGGHDFITSGDGVSATQRYSSLHAWGGAVAVTYDQVLPGGTTSSETATIADGAILYGVLENVAVTDGGTCLGYRLVE